VRIGANETLTVVGVAADVRHYGLAEELEPMLYRPLAQLARSNVTIVARHSSADPAALIREIRAAVWAQDATIPLSASGTLQQQVSASLVQPRFYTALLAGFSVVALALAFVGLYGTLAYTVRTRRREVGIRVALGAGMGDVRGMVVAQGMRLAGVGIALGFAGSLLASRALRTLVFGVTTTDLPTFTMVAAAMAAVALVACWFPARRAARTDPMITLRSD
jgi:predicted lysophospholipase L1 biosynthesis ABC-type transport system permease subunit